MKTTFSRLIPNGKRRVHRTLYSRRCYHEKTADNLLSQYASHPPRPLNLSTLLSFGRPLTQQSILRSASYALSEIPRRLATRVRALEALPFIVGTNPFVAGTLRAYQESFKCLATYPSVKIIEDNAAFAAQLDVLVRGHAHDIPTMAKGYVVRDHHLPTQSDYSGSFQECSRYMTPTEISNFLDGAIRNRISVRLIAEQHIALSQAIDDPQKSNAHVGVIDLTCSPSKMIKTCGAFVEELCNATLGASPSIVIDGHADATFAYVQTKALRYYSALII